MRIFFTLLLAVCLFIPATLSAGEKKLSSSRKNALIDSAIMQHPFFEIAIKGNKKFRKSWLKEFTRLEADRPDKNEQSLAIEAGVSMAMDEVDPYLAKASDEAAINFFSFFTELMAASAKDETLCGLLTESKSNGNNHEKNVVLDDKYSDVWIPKMLLVMPNVFITGSVGEPRFFTKEQNEQAQENLVKRIIEEHGVSVIQRAGELEDQTVPAKRRCETMSWLVKAIDDLPPADRAMLLRSMFSDSKDKD